MNGQPKRGTSPAASPGLRLAAAALACAALSAAAAGTPRDLAQMGAGIYHAGDNGAGRPIFAMIGSADVRLPGATLACAGCHGPDGLGRPEGGIEPVPLTWDHLTKPYGHRHANGRGHPAFTEATLKRAITLGVDPAGNRLDAAMPRFEMAEEDLDALIAYLKRLGSEGTPGVTDSEIALGVLVPREGRLGEAGAAAAALMAAYVEEINEQARLYGRALVLRTERLGEDPAAAAAAVERLIAEPVLALIAAVPPGLQPAVTERVEQEGVPIFHLWPPAAAEDPDQRRYSFYLLAGLRQETEQLIEFADRELPLVPRRAALVVPSPDVRDPLVAAVSSRWPDATAIGPPATMTQARRIVGGLRADGVNVLSILARSPGVAALLQAAAEAGWFPYVLVPGSLAGEWLTRLPSGFDGRVLVASPAIPASRDARDLKRIEALRASAGGSTAQLFSEAAAYGTVSLIVEALRKAGRKVSRDALIAAVEQLYEFRSGLLPPLTYGPNRRIGAAEIRIVRAR